MRSRTASSLSCRPSIVDLEISIVVVMIDLSAKDEVEVLKGRRETKRVLGRKARRVKCLQHAKATLMPR